MDSRIEETLLPTKLKLLLCSDLTTKSVIFSSQYRKHLHIYIPLYLLWQ